VVDRAILMQIPEHMLVVAPAHELEPPIIAMRGERIHIAVDAAMRALSADEDVTTPKVRSPKSVA